MDECKIPVKATRSGAVQIGEEEVEGREGEWVSPVKKHTGEGESYCFLCLSRARWTIVLYSGRRSYTAAAPRQGLERV
ncbi:hypothetical protein AALP_AAs59235U000200 [Arabis alpina]|uniref:Uncharacterized protein n=1 Tax=Arabis alpina TaxID=50452 RepID=A0A087G2A5_ARAAL|nr:hypothetical protein AALP_AAs59235U000200 [Arabis alpina]